MGERPDEIKSGDRTLRQHDVRSRGSDDIAGRAAEETLREPTDTARIRSDIARTRDDMSETIDAIQDKLSPGNLMSQARDSVKEATVGAVRQAASSVGQTASEVTTATRDAAVEFAGNVRRNPWPAVLIGAGTAWLLIDQGSKGSRGGRRSTKREYRDDGTVGYYDLEGGSPSSRSVASSRPAYDSGRRFQSSTASSLREASREAMQTAQESVSRASSQMRDLLDRNPLVVGAVAAAVGVAIGLAIPETERENQLMGEARDSLVERAQGAAQDAVEKVKQVAGDAADKI